jgi:hypothetical protein
MLDAGACRAIWAVIESGQPRSLDDIAMTAQVKPSEAVSYVSALTKNGFMEMFSTRTAGSGETIPMFRMCRKSLKIPYLDGNKLVFGDRNSAGPTETPKPSPVDRLRIAAMKFERPFTRRELLIAAGFDPLAKDDWYRVWTGLRHRGECMPVSADLFEYTDPKGFSKDAKYIEEHAGEPWRLLGLRGKTILAILSDRGWQIETLKTGGRTTYRIFGKQEGL